MQMKILFYRGLSFNIIYTLHKHMLLHYIKSAWSHLRKYKVQNTISVLCLAVGVVCFTLTLHVIYSISMFSPDMKARKRYVEIDFYTKTDAGREYHDLDSAFIAQINQRHLKSIREVRFRAPILAMDFCFEDGSPLPKTFFCNLINVSPRWLHLWDMHSAITRKTIPELEEGDIVITDDVRDRVYGRGADPRGYHILNEIDGSLHTIRDVVSASVMTMYNTCNIFYISKSPIADVYTSNFNSIYIEPGEGYTREMVMQELSAAFPKHEFLIPESTSGNNQTEYTVSMIMAILILLFIGGSVLMIGVSGYLKMQTQLFTLRSRELALRRTLGAHPRQLFFHLACETIIIFLFTAIATSIITSLLTPYILTPYRNAGIILAYEYDLRIFHNIKWLVLLGTMIATLCMAAWMVRRQLYEPISMRIGRSGFPRSKGQGMMMCIQFVVSIILLSVTLFACDKLIRDDYEQYVVTTPDCTSQPDFSQYRNAMVVDRRMADYMKPDFSKSLSSIQEIDHVSNVIHVMYETTIPDTVQLLHHKYKLVIKDNVNDITRYSMLATDEQIVDRLGIEISTTDYSEDARWQFASYVYARTEDIERLRNKWHLQPIQNAPVHNTLRGNHSYTLLGYAPCPKGYQHASPFPTPSYWIIDDEAHVEDFISKDNPDEPIVRADYIIFPSQGHYKDVEHEVQSVLQKARPGNLNPSICKNLYDTWFARRKMFDMIRSICFLPALISILCIIAAVYSAVSLECRGRRKEIALRKIHGAHRSDIMRMIGGRYRSLLRTACILSVVISAVIGAMIQFLGGGFSLDVVLLFCTYMAAAILMVYAVTMLTIGQKIRDVSRLSAADVIAKE